MSDMNVGPHYCEHEHEPIGHAGDDERCPLCRMRDDLAAARNAYEMQRQDCINLTEKVIPNIRDDLAAVRTLLREVLDCDQQAIPDWLTNDIDTMLDKGRP